jgi:hypothetical protein
MKRPAVTPRRSCRARLDGQRILENEELVQQILASTRHLSEPIPAPRYARHCRPRAMLHPALVAPSISPRDNPSSSATIDAFITTRRVEDGRVHSGPMPVEEGNAGAYARSRR